MAGELFLNTVPEEGEYLHKVNIFIRIRALSDSLRIGVTVGLDYASFQDQY